jgi:ArsR family transcriptional regulator
MAMTLDGRLRTQYQARAAVMKALAHPTRLFFVDELARGPRCVCELTALVGADVSTVSKHLAVLRNAGIVDDEKRGAQVFYSLRTPCVRNWYTCVEGVLENTARRSRQIRGRRP